MMVFGDIIYSDVRGNSSFKSKRVKNGEIWFRFPIKKSDLKTIEVGSQIMRNNSRRSYYGFNNNYLRSVCFQEYRVKMQNYQGKRFKEKSVNFDTCRLTVSTFVCSAIGFLQITERSLMNALDQAETASVTSLNNVVKQLDGFATVSTFFFVLNRYPYCV